MCVVAIVSVVWLVSPQFVSSKSQPIYFDTQEVQSPCLTTGWKVLVLKPTIVAEEQEEGRIKKWVVEGRKDTKRNKHFVCKIKTIVESTGIWLKSQGGFVVWNMFRMIPVCLIVTEIPSPFCFLFMTHDIHKAIPWSVYVYAKMHHFGIFRTIKVVSFWIVQSLNTQTNHNEG